MKKYIIDPLAELNQCIFNSANGFSIFVVNILQDCNSANLPDNPCKQSASILRIIPNNHKLVTQLREQGFYSFSRFGKSRKCRFPFFLITPVWYFQSDIGCFKQIQLYLGAYISSVSYDCTITIVHFYILQVMNIMYTCLGKVKGMDDST